MKKPRNNYVDNKKFQAEMLVYQERRLESGDENLKANDFIGKCISDISYHYAQKPKFFGYSESWKQEMILDGIENCIKYGLKNYDATRFSNPLAYFTEIVHWSFVRRIKREKIEQYKKLKNQQNNSLLTQLSNNKYIPEDNEVVNELIADFEVKLAVEKTKRNTKKGVAAFVKT